MNKDDKSVSAKTLGLLLKTMERLHHIKDLRTLLDSILYESRRFTRSDAGSIYLVENGRLHFSYVQNDTIFKKDVLSNKYIYSNHELPIDKHSLAGYVALTGRSLLIDDAYEISKRSPYGFNRYFDEISSYRTKSMLVVPMQTSRGDVVGVLQLINCTNHRGTVVPYTNEQKLLVCQFAFQAAVAIDRAVTLRELLLRLVGLSELRDPEEKQQHLYRVSAYSAELYQRWAERHGVPREEMMDYRDHISLAAMLHDIGKVGVPDHLLKKRGELTDVEFDSIKLHTVYGVRLFANTNSELERIAHEIILNHHERWDGGGYPGHFTVDGDLVSLGPGKKGGETPLSARILAVADVYDALANRRAYKDAWEEDAVLFYMKNESGRHFDPELVELFFEIYDIIKAIRSKWS